LQTQATADNRFAEAKVRADREHNGKDGSAKGDGPRFKAAIKDKADAQADLVKARAQVAIYQPRVEQAEQQLKKARDQLDQAELASRDDIAKLEAEKNAELTTLHSDPFSARRALQEIYADPETGADARYFSFVMKLVLITLELSYLMVRIIFAHTSVYTILLLADTKLRADATYADYRRRSAALRADEPREPPRALPPLRLMSWHRPTVPPPDGGTPRHRDHTPDDDREAAD
jgi:hypothetical protein